MTNANETKATFSLPVVDARRVCGTCVNARSASNSDPCRACIKGASFALWREAKA